MTRSKSGQRRKIAEALAIVAQALGDAGRRGEPHAEKFVPMTQPTEPIEIKGESVLVLTLKEAAVHLGITTTEMEAMVKRGTVKSVVAGWTTMVLTVTLTRARRERLI